MKTQRFHPIKTVRVVVPLVRGVWLLSLSKSDLSSKIKGAVALMVF